MSSRLQLTLPPSCGNRIVEVAGKRFSIGRTPGNDLVIDDASLSRRHALIEDLGEQFTLTDCGSANGTFVNGRQVMTQTGLSDWDVLTFGGVSDILVRIEDSAAVDEGPAKQPGDKFIAAEKPFSPQARQPQNTGSSFSRPLVAVAAAVVILLVTGLVLLIGHGLNSNRNSNPPVKKQPRPPNNENLDAETPDESTTPQRTDSDQSDSGEPELSAIEAYASRVLTGISRDTHPVLAEKQLAAINAELQRYKGSSSLLDELRAMKRALPQVSAIARSNGLRPQMAVYATLARIDQDGGRGDPVQVAAGLCPALAKMRAVFGDELANDSLLTVAGLEEGAGLQNRITKLSSRATDSPATIRSIWYLHEHQIVSDGTYSFVLKFITLGTIAQDPRKFGIAADPLTF